MDTAEPASCDDERVSDARVLPVIAECRLDVDALRHQRDRYRALGRQVVESERRADRLTVRFGPTLDAGLLEKTVTTERDCCPFFELAIDARRRELVVAVSRPDHEPALDALADALGVEHR